MLSTDYEQPLWESLSRVCGIDEAGRGPLAGPVVAAAVVFPRHFRPSGILAQLNDSKTLTPELRRELAPAIRQAAESWAVSAVDAETIDRINILQATMLAMNRAAESLGAAPELLLVDGNRFRPVLPVPFETIVKGDSKVFSIAAASVLAKTHRDELMTGYAAEYPEYGFDRHFGYPTGAHVEAIARHGRCALHRKSFRLRKLGEK
ncbi:MAG: ribonuclease HII [Chlorobiaceae bacterium]|nr:ribonuclease HII [Chlorobiaceae bacterium]